MWPACTCSDDAWDVEIGSGLVRTVTIIVVAAALLSAFRREPYRLHGTATTPRCRSDRPCSRGSGTGQHRSSGCRLQALEPPGPAAAGAIWLEMAIRCPDQVIGVVALPPTPRRAVPTINEYRGGASDADESMALLASGQRLRTVIRSGMEKNRADLGGVGSTGRALTCVVSRRRFRVATCRSASSGRRSTKLHVAWSPGIPVRTVSADSGRCRSRQVAPPLCGHTLLLGAGCEGARNAHHSSNTSGSTGAAASPIPSRGSFRGTDGRSTPACRVTTPAVPFRASRCGFDVSGVSWRRSLLKTLPNGPPFSAGVVRRGISDVIGRNRLHRRRRFRRSNRVRQSSSGAEPQTVS